jgi:hypothetical protein
VNHDSAFLTLARRLGNPIAERPDAIATLEIVQLGRALRGERRRDQLMRVTLDCIARLRGSPRPGEQAS